MKRGRHWINDISRTGYSSVRLFLWPVGRGWSDATMLQSPPTGYATPPARSLRNRSAGPWLEYH